MNANLLLGIGQGLLALAFLTVSYGHSLGFRAVVDAAGHELAGGGRT